MNRSGTLIYGDARISYAINEVATRTTRVAIHVDPDGSVVVDAPPGQPDESIAGAVHRRARWIVAHVFDARGRFQHVTPKEYVSGEQVLYLGRRYVLKVVRDDGDPGSAGLRGNRLEIRSPDGTRAKTKTLMRLWYRDRASDYFRRRIVSLSKELPWVAEVPPFRLMEMKRQWGNCSVDGVVTLNPHLIKAPRECVDYVIVHELAHLKHHDHGASFTKLVSDAIPTWRRTKDQLDDLAEVLLHA